MRICIFDEHFSTLGGGEKHIGAIAELLSISHDVFIIHKGAFDHSAISNRLNLNLNKVTFIDTGTWHDVNIKVIELVRDIAPDCFINATHFSRLTIEGMQNIALIFFPKYIYPRSTSFKEYLKYRIGNWLFAEYIKNIEFNNFSAEEFTNGCFGRWSHAQSEIVIKKPFKHFIVRYENLKNTVIKDVINSISLHGKLNFFFDSEKIFFQYHYNEKNPCKLRFSFNTFNPSKVEKGSSDTRELGLFITRVEIDTFSYRTKLVLWFWKRQWFKHQLTKLYVKSNCLREQLSYQQFLKQKDLLLSNSNYTDKWIKKIYGKTIQSNVLYPPVDIKDFYAKPKQNKIIAVGRFFVGDHNKKQLELIKFFKTLYETFPPAREYSFHLCGGTHKEERHQQYLELCKQSAEGYPIFFHQDIKYENLKELYATSAIFWHAAGLYEDEEKTPDKFEHFGITTIEAMASGCVPVVFGMAGQKEIVEHEKSGFQWKTSDELLKSTKKLIKNNALLISMSKNAMERSRQYEHDVFKKRTKELFDQVNIKI